jgi:hypothetical protein
MDPYAAAVIVTGLANAFAICRALYLRVQQTFPWVIVLLGYQLCQLVVLGALSPRSRVYLHLYVLSEPLVSVFAILVVREMYQRAFAGYPGISSLARWATRAAGAAAIVICAVMLAITPPTELSPRVIYRYASVWEECVLFMLSVFILIMVVILWRYPIRVESNLAANIAIFTIFFFGTAALLAALTAPGLEKTRNFGLLGVYVICYLAWGFLLKRTSEISIVRMRPGLNAEEAEHLLVQLGAINNMLARSVRR